MFLAELHNVYESIMGIVECLEDDTAGWLCDICKKLSLKSLPYIKAIMRVGFGDPT